MDTKARSVATEAMAFLAIMKFQAKPVCREKFDSNLSSKYVFQASNVISKAR